ncbi:choice-of-anchor D domain-containing protein [Kribbella ginsengisoli]|uniref:Fibronectin type-III domain-containing protein n=1 Tax=Kribbella ginsengisoli TaxID=363865 RepID=A0ABP6YNJ7_9ACTN
MRRARKTVLLRTALAAALAAITVPFIAHAAFGDEAVTAPTAQVFPTRQGVGIVWSDVDAAGYRVERRQAAADWQDVSGTLAASATSWIDESIPAGSAAEYRVIGESDSAPATSPSVTATRVEEPPAVGDIDALALDANRGAGVTWLQNETATPVTASAPADGSRVLSAGSLKVKLPAFIAGPGNYDLPQVALTQGDRTCSTEAVLRVKAVSYTPDLQLETFAASLAAWSCAGSAVTVAAELRFHSAIGYQALSVTPDKLDAGRVEVGSSVNQTVTLKNTGTEAVKFGPIALNNGAGPDWTLARECGQSLPAGASCTLTVKFLPDEGRAGYWARLTIEDSTTLNRHTVEMTGTGTSLPKAPQSINVVPTYRGLALRWQDWPSAGGTPVRGYFLHRYLDGQETTQWVDAGSSWAGWITVTETVPKPGTEYALSVVNEIGDGPIGARVKAARPTAQIALTEGPAGTRELTAATLDGTVVGFAVGPDSVTPKAALASAPDGRSLAFVTSNTDKVLWAQRVAPGGIGVPLKLWTSQAAITHLSWSPDGTRIAFQTPENGTPCVSVISAAGGTPEKVACDVTSPSWMPDAQTLIVVDRRLAGDDRFARIQAKAGGARVATLAAPTAAADGMPVRVSPDGRLVAFGSGSTVRLIDFTSASVLTSPPLPAPIRSLSWDPDGEQLLALGVDDQVHRLNPGRLEQTPTKLPGGPAGHRLDIAWQRLGLTIAPTAGVLGPQVSIGFDASALLPGTTFTCAVDGSTPAACTSPYVATNLRSGEQTLTITATEPDGRVTKAFRTFTVDATGPVARTLAPAYQGSTATTAAVKVTATDANGVATYDVRYRRASYAGAYSAYVQPWTNTTATSMNLAMAAGYEYCVSVRAKDKLGNVGQWSAERCFSRPMDDRLLTLATTGWTRASGSAFYLGTTTQTSAYGKALTRSVQGKRFFLVATRCPTCGSVAVYAGSKYLTTLNLASPTTQRQVLLGLPVQTTLFSGTLTFSTRSTGKLVQIDGLAVGRT